MTSEQKYEGKGNSALPNEQTVKNDSQAAAQTESAAQDGTTTPGELPNALSTSPNSVTTQPVAGSVQTAPSAKPVVQDAMPVTPEQPTPPISPQLVRGDEEPLLVPLASYFSKVTASRANVVAFRELLHTVFVHYATSPEFLHRNHVPGIDEISILKSFYAGIATFVERTADYRLGSRLPLDPGPLPGEADQPDPIVDPAAYVSYGGDVLTVTDVATLQGWVTMLQTQNEVTAIRLEKEAQAFRGEIEELRSKLELERDRLLIANRKIAELESRPAPVAAPSIPTPPRVEYSINLSLGLGYGSHRTAEVNLVQQSLEDNYTATLRRAFNAIAEGEYDNAYVEFADAELIKELLAEISSSLHDAALNSLVVAKGRFDTSKVYDANFETFMHKYLPGISA